MGCIASKPKSTARVSIEPSSKPTIDYSATHVAKTVTDIYRIGNGLGSGAFAEVKKCEHKATRQDRAVKIYKKNPAKPEQRESLQREFNILRTLDHPNIVGIFEHFEDDRRFYMVMEYCKGGEMFNSIVKGANTNEAMVARTMRQVLSAIAYIHDKRIVHRDMKPENILFEELGNEQNLKLVDFGEAVYLDENNQVSGVCGTSYYVAPEVLTGSHYNQLCDVWSCGVIMYLLLSGKVPFNGHDDAEIVHKVKIGEYKIDTPEFAQVSPEAVDLIKKMICPVEIRVSALEALQHPWMRRFFHVEPNEDKLESCMRNLQKYVRGSLLQEAISCFVVTHNLSRQETKKLRDIFLKLNTSGTSELIPSELIAQYALSNPVPAATDIVKKIFSELDPSHSGKVEFKAFLSGAIDMKEILCRSSVELALAVFAVEANGKANVVEMRRMLFIEPERFLPAWEDVLSDTKKTDTGDMEVSDLVNVICRKLKITN